MVFFYAFGGEEREGDVGWYMAREASDFGVCVLTMVADLLIDPTWDMALPATISLLDDLCDEGLIDGYMNASPCSTWSRARFRPGGPRPLRHRGDWAWGLPGPPFDDS